MFVKMGGPKILKIDKAPSFAENDVVIVDPTNVGLAWDGKAQSVRSNGSLWNQHNTDGGFSLGLTQHLIQRKAEINMLLEITGGILVCFVKQQSPKLHCKSSTEHDRTAWALGTYTWLPIEFELLPREGNEIREIDKSHAFADYFTELAEDIFYEAVIPDGKLLSSSKILARNRVGEVLAIEKSIENGKIIFIPPVKKEYDTKKVGGVLFNCIRGMTQGIVVESKPQWISDYILPGNSEIKAKKEVYEQNIKKLEDEKTEVEKRLLELDKLRSLLYEQGKFKLEPAVRAAFRLIGFNVLEPEDYDEDYDLFIQNNDPIIIGEIEGSQGQIDVRKYRQLLDYHNAEYVINGKNCKGILIGNGFKNEDPENRGEQFTEQAIRGCENMGFCRLTTYELFKAVNVVLADPENNGLKQTIRQGILDCTGEFKFEMTQC